MAINPMVQETANKMEAMRGGKPMPMQGPPREVTEENPPSGLAEIRAHLTAALEMLDNLGAGD